ncbi:MAG: tRNA (adenosine(37)-N6)-threonylcarbamoyltransferase complex dimerization subunit type 1 TsaB [Burkholderiaceae bacterium]|jgi:tRNA threonylcarbamoyladenosine biosynthesis protein TsaB
MVLRPSYVIALEASTEEASLAVAIDGPPGRSVQVIDEVVLQGHAAHAGQMLPALQGLLSKYALQAADCRLIGVDVGPGGFTGLRTVCAFAQALATGWQIRCATMPSLELMAIEAHGLAAVRYGAAAADGLWLSVLDARLGQVYCATYCIEHLEADQGRAAPLVRLLDGPRLDVLASLLGGADSRVLAGMAVCGLADHQVSTALESSSVAQPGCGCFELSPRAAVLARMVSQRSAEHAVDPIDCQPSYVRQHVAQTIAERRQIRHA